jgi:hypothetical protein
MSGQNENHTNEHVTEYLKYFVNLDNPKYAVMLIGKWGCGKTYYIKNLIKNWGNENAKDKKDTVVLKPVYISLNGISNTTTITDMIKSEISPFIYKTTKIAQKTMRILSKIAIKTDLNFDNNAATNENITFTPDIMSVFSSKDKNIKGNKILIFDDVERCKVGKEELFGYINNFVEHLECKVILIANEDIINSEDIYKKIKEKLVGQTFEIESDIETAVDIFIENSKEVNIELDLSPFKDLIIEVFNASQTNNIRVLRQALLDFRRLVKFIEKKFIKHSRYNEFLKNFLSYFLIVYLEYKTGNDKVSEFQNSISAYLSNNKEETENDRLAQKYNPTLDKMQILDSMYVFPIGELLYYIQKGFINNSKLNNQLEQSTFFLSEKSQDWEKLWCWRILNDNEFIEIRDRVWEQFRKGNITEPLVVTYIAGTMLSLIGANMLKKNRAFIVSKAKSILKRIFEKDKYVDKNNVYGLLQNAREYNAESSSELKEITNYLYKQVKNGREKLQKEEMKNFFENLQNDSVLDIYPSKLYKPLPDYSTSYENSAIFQSVNGKILGKRIKTFNTKSIRDFKNFIHYRYYPDKRFPHGDIKDYHKDDLQCLEDLKIELSKKHNRKEKIKNIAINELLTELENIIQKLNKPPCTTP